MGCPGPYRDGNGVDPQAGVIHRGERPHNNLSRKRLG